MLVEFLLIAAVQLPVAPVVAAQIESAWRIDDGAVFHLGPDGPRALRALPGRAPGLARQLTVDASGTAYVAAQGGLFIAAPDCDVLDRVDFDFGEPPGAPVGVAVAGPNRVWLLTETALCAVETRQFLWSTLDSALPSPPLRSLHKRSDGQYEIEGSTGVVVLDLDRASPEPWPTARVVGRAPREDGAHALELREPLELDLPDAHRLRWMWREAGRFRWLPLDEASPRLEFTRPGRQAVCVVAFDAALRRSDEQRLEVDVAYPPSLDRSALALGIGAPALAFIALSVWLAWRRARTPSAAWRGFLSAAIAIVLTLQLAAAVFPHSKGWPFVGFTMYTRVSERDSLSYRHEFIGLAPNGKWRLLTPPGGAFGKYENERALQPFIHDDSRRSARFLDEWNRARPSERLVGVADLCRRRRMTPDGPVEVPRLVMFAHPPEIARALP